MLLIAESTARTHTCPHRYPLSNEASSYDCEPGAQRMAKCTTKNYTNNILQYILQQ